jgi:hypothetical protein
LQINKVIGSFSGIGLRVLAALSVMWGVIANIYFFPRLDVDPYHDGFIYPMALFASEGKIPNKDFFSMYGPIGPLIQGAWLDLFGANLLNLRFHGALLILVISALMFNIMKDRIGVNTALFFSSIWMVGNPLIVQPSLPWVDLYTTIILLLGITFINFVDKRQDFNHRNFLVLGAFFAIGLFTKINFAIPLLATLLLIVFFFGWKNGLHFALGIITTLTAFLIIMFTSDSLKGYIEQGIVFPFSMHDEGKSIRGLFNMKILAFGVGILFLLRLIKRFGNSIKSHKVTLLATAVMFSAVAILTALFFRDLSVPFSALTGDFSKDLANLLKNLPYSLFFGTVLFAVISIISTILKRVDYHLEKKEILTIVIGFSSVLQLYPNPEPAHIWYVFPVAIIGSVILAPRIIGNTDQQLYSKLFLIPLCAALISINFQYISIDRELHKENPLIGMKSEAVRTMKIDSTLENLSNKVGKLSVQYHCPLGIYSVANNKYYGSDYQYVELIPSFNKPRLKSDLIFSCDLSIEEAKSITEKNSVLFETSGPTPYGTNILYVNPGE